MNKKKIVYYFVLSVNAIIRLYMDCSKNHIYQETLNLIMFYHNHRRYKAGKRKGKTPMEILTQKEQQKDWLELLFETVEQKDPVFFLVHIGPDYK